MKINRSDVRTSDGCRVWRRCFAVEHAEPEEETSEDDDDHAENRSGEAQQHQQDRVQRCRAGGVVVLPVVLSSQVGVMNWAFRSWL